MSVTNNFIVVSYYTINSGYEMEVKRLKRSLDEFALPYDINPMPNKGNWFANVSARPQFILNMLNRYQRPVVWLDADARVIQYPYLFHLLRCDFAAHWRDHKELLGGTMYWNNTKPAIDLLQAWVNELAKRSNGLTQKALQDILEQQTNCDSVNLPASYCYIDFMNIKSQPVIEHLQASRRFHERNYQCSAQ